jgi:hypothetical protein
MITAKFAGRGGAMTRIAPHATGHDWSRNGRSDEDAHRVAACWAQDKEKP